MTIELKCPSCGSRDALCLGTMSQLMGWTPHLKDGVQHSHDPNRHRTGYRCSNGHYWEHRWFAACPGCDVNSGSGTIHAVENWP